MLNHDLRTPGGSIYDGVEPQSSLSQPSLYGMPLPKKAPTSQEKVVKASVGCSEYFAATLAGTSLCKDLESRLGVRILCVPKAAEPEDLLKAVSFSAKGNARKWQLEVYGHDSKVKEALLSLDGLGAPLREIAKRKGNDLFLTVPAIDRAFGADRALLNDVRTRYPSVHIQLHPSNDNRSGQVVLKGGTREELDAAYRELSVLNEVGMKANFLHARREVSDQASFRFAFLRNQRVAEEKASNGLSTPMMLQSPIGRMRSRGDPLWKSQPPEAYRRMELERECPQDDPYDVANLWSNPDGTAPAAVLDAAGTTLSGSSTPTFEDVTQRLPDRPHSQSRRFPLKNHRLPRQASQQLQAVASFGDFDAPENLPQIHASSQRHSGRDDWGRGRRRSGYHTPSHGREVPPQSPSRPQSADWRQSMFVDTSDHHSLSQASGEFVTLAALNATREQDAYYTPVSTARQTHHRRTQRGLSPPPDYHMRRPTPGRHSPLGDAPPTGRLPRSKIRSPIKAEHQRRHRDRARGGSTLVELQELHARDRDLDRPSIGPGSGRGLDAPDPIQGVARELASLRSGINRWNFGHVA